MVRCMIMQGLKLYVWYGICMMIKYMYDFIKSRMLNSKALANTKNKYILITGATDGIGKALALNFAKRKYNLIIMGRSSEKLESVKQEIMQNNVECITLIKDFSQEIDFLELMEYEIGLLINNVGMCSEGPRMFIDDVRYQDIINVNLKNTFKLTQLVLIKMMQVKMGYIVNIGSITGSIPMPMLATYASSKAAIGSWTEALHTECKPWNVNVELMNTGYVATKMSGIKKSSMFCPSPDVYANCIVKHFGSGNESFAYFPHLFFAVLLFMIPRYVVAKVCLLLQLSTRKKIDMKKSKKRTD